MKEILAIMALTGVGLLTYSAGNMVRLRKQKSCQDDPPEEVEEVTLAEVSGIWTGKEFFIQDLSKLWRERVDKTSLLPRPAFRHEEIESFFAEAVEHATKIEGVRRTVIVKLLHILDEEGDCPSVVRMNPLEAEAKLTDDAFSMLATIPLYRHTLNVARRCVAKTGHESMFADLLLASLAHDLGKIPFYHDRMYATGDHPVISAMIVNRVAEFASLPNRSELDKIIKGHHHLKPDNAVTDMLKQFDHEARQEELAFLLTEAKNENRTHTPEEIVALPSMVQPPSTNRVISHTQELLHQEQREHPLGESQAKERLEYQFQPLPGWFDPEAILAALARRINRIEETSEGPRWELVSTSKGIVYAQPDGLWAAISEVSGRDPVVLTSDANEEAKRNLLFTVVWELSRRKDAIVTELVGPRYYTAQATVLTGSGKGYTAFLIPFRAEIFAESLAALEELKPAPLKRMVKDIRPKQKETEKCVI